MEAKEEKIENENWEAIRKGNEIIVKEYDIKNKAILGTYIYIYNVKKLGNKEYRTSCIDHYYVASDGERYGYNPSNYQYRSNRHYFSGSPDYTTANEMAEKLLH